MKICICTSYSAAAEPRAPRHAISLAALDRSFEVIFLECLAINESTGSYDPFAAYPNIERKVHRYPTRRDGFLRLVVAKTARSAARLLYRFFGYLHPVALNTHFLGFESRLRAIKADVYLGHNVETLIPICRAAAAHDGIAIFDSMEFHSGMGDSQDRLDTRITAAIEERYLPQCALVLASSDEMADALGATYGIGKPLALYNVPPVDSHVHDCNHEGLSLYWRNAVLGFGQRGLQDVLRALQTLPQEIVLHLQGRLPADGGAELRARIKSLGLTSRVFIHGPYSPPDAVKVASRYCVGLCLEHGGIRNHELTVSNKMFDYLMAGLVVVASDLPSLRAVIDRSAGGLCFTPGDPIDLAAKILQLNNDRALRLRLALNARAFALNHGNREIEIRRFQGALRGLMPIS